MGENKGKYSHKNATKDILKMLFNPGKIISF